MTANDTPSSGRRPGPRLRWVRTPLPGSPGFVPSGWMGNPGAEELLSSVRAASGRSPRENRWVVRGGPGTGKTTLLSAAVAGLVAGGTWGNRIAVVGSSARAVAGLRLSLAAALAANGVEGTAAASTEPQVRTLHSLAYAIVSLAAARRGVPAPRLLTGAEHDAIFRQSLLGVTEDGGLDWPEQVRPALATRGFARELRDVVLRLSERNVPPDRLEEIGRARGRDLWVAAARFARAHEQEMALREATGTGEDPFPGALNAAQLVGAALDELAADPELLTGDAAIEALVVDDAQMVDPMAGELLSEIARRGSALIVAHGPDEAVFRFRGASDAFVRAVGEQGGRIVDLAHVFRGPASAGAQILARRLPGREAWRDESRTGGAPGAAAAGAEGEPAASPAGSAGAAGRAVPAVSVRTERSASEEASVVADYLLRMHHVHGVPWEEMAVVFRSVGEGAELFQRTCDSVGIPVVDAGAEVPPAEDPMVRALLEVVEAVLSPPDELGARALLMGPLGRADPADFRDLRRTLRRDSLTEGTPVRSMSAVRDLLVGEAEPLDVLGEDAFGRLSTPVIRIRQLLAVVERSIASGDSVEMVLWNLWHASRKSHALRAAVEAGGVGGRAADRSADAVMGLFDHAADFVEQMPRGSLRQFVEIMREQELPAPRRAGRRPTRKAVNLLSAHTSVATEFRVVVVSGVQEGSWPAPRRRFGLFELDLLVDLLDRGEDPDTTDAEREIAAMAEAAVDERRLVVLAASRAREHLLVTAVENGEDLAASQYLSELTRAGVPEWTSADAGTGNLVAGHRMFTPAALVADLRVELQSAPGSPRAAAAAGILSLLRRSGFAQADPRRWYRAAPVSSAASPVPARDSGPRARISPSAFQQLEACPLQWFVGRKIASSSAMPLLKGNVVHAVAEAIQQGVRTEPIEALVREFWPAMSPARGWVLEGEITAIMASESALRGWLDAQGGYTSLGQELEFRMEVLPGGPTVEVADVEVPAVDVVVSGRIDRLDADPSGAVRAVDFKSGTTQTTGEAEANPQLALYQLAVRLGAVGAEVPPRVRLSEAGTEADDPVSLTAGGVLVHVKAKNVGDKAAERHQSAMGPETHLGLLRRVTAAGAQSLGPVYTARTSKACDSCAAAVMCPTQTSGRQVGS